MQINRELFRQKALGNPEGYSDASWIKVNRSPSSKAWRVVAIHHLDPAENGMNHHLYADLLGSDGAFIDRPDQKGCKLAWTWENRQGSERADPVNFEKSGDEPRANLPIWKNATVSAWIDGSFPSDVVTGLITGLDSEAGDAPGNALHHNSYYVLWQLIDSDAAWHVVDEKPTPPVATKPTVPSEEWYVPASNVVDALAILRSSLDEYFGNVLEGYPGDVHVLSEIFGQVDNYVEEVQAVFIK